MMIKKGGEGSGKNYYETDETDLNSPFVDPNRKEEERKKIYYMNPKLEYAFNLPQNVSAALHRGTNIFMNPATVSELIRAIDNNKSIERITNLINKATNLNSENSRGFTPLMAAIYANNKDIVELLINKGADVNDDNKYGLTPLLAAIKNSNHEKEKENYRVSCDIVQLLIDRGANISALNRAGANPIESAIHGSNIEIIDLLFKNGVNINDKNGSGNTPLHLAVYENNPSIVNFLIGKGADINEINDRKMTPIQVAKDKLEFRRYRTEDENINTDAIVEVLQRKEAEKEEKSE
jgi:ankyrin repeat protein